MPEFYPQRGVRLLLEGWSAAGLTALPKELVDPAVLSAWIAESQEAATKSAAKGPPPVPPKPAFQPRGGFGTAPSSPSTPAPASPSIAVPSLPAVPLAAPPAAPVVRPVAAESPVTTAPPTSPRPAPARGALFELDSAPLAKSTTPKTAPQKNAESPASTVAAASTGLPGQPRRLAAALEAKPRPAAERDALLTVLNDRVKGCQRCKILAAQRTQTVFGVGNSQARLAFVGEAPGADEDASGIPFVGRAGQLLDKIIAAAGFRREDLYICNVLRCRPPDNRAPEPQECANCREFLEDQLAVVNPEYIVCWGAVAATNITGKQVAIGKLRKQFFTFHNAKVLCTYHPSYLLRNPAAKKDVWDDMKLLLAEMGLPVPA